MKKQRKPRVVWFVFNDERNHSFVTYDWKEARAWKRHGYAPVKYVREVKRGKK
jgi:hypothetical protein